MFSPITDDEFERRVGCIPHCAARAQAVVSLRDLDPEKITSVQVMSLEYLERLIHAVPLEGNITARPYAQLEIKPMRIDPHGLVIGQTFVERGKYQSLLEEFGVLLQTRFCVSRGAAKCNALMVFGKTRAGGDAVAHYIPPIIEEADDGQFLLDGIHRNFLVMRVGTTIESIVIKRVAAPLPCRPQPWSTIKVVNVKPERNERFHGLRRELFRDLKYAGIDG